MLRAIVAAMVVGVGFAVPAVALADGDGLERAG
jgi:hypothetical protein